MAGLGLGEQAQAADEREALRGFWAAAGRFALLMLVLQAVRAGVTLYEWNRIGPGDMELLWNQIHLVSFAVAVPAFLLLTRPSIKDLGLDLRRVAARERAFYLNIGGLLVALIYALRLRDSQLLERNLVFAVVVPVYEELLFRGYGWTKIRQAGRHYPEWITLAVVTILFGAWHLGYGDILLLRAIPYNFATEPPLATAVLLKLGAALVLGLVSGIVRWRTGHVYGSILIHGFWNLISA